jgi:DNA-binding CsgD family transcriptional regulator
MGGIGRNGVAGRRDADPFDFDEYAARQLPGLLDHWHLDAREKRVAILLFFGFDRRRIAAFMGRSEHTAKSDVARVYSRLEVNSRHAFERLLTHALWIHFRSRSGAGAGPVEGLRREWTTPRGVGTRLRRMV